MLQRLTSFCGAHHGTVIRKNHSSPGPKINWKKTGAKKCADLYFCPHLFAIHF
jgi:hypothetical protein